LRKLREACIRERLNYTWTAAGQKLFSAYQVAIDSYAAARKVPAPNQILKTAAQPGVPAASQATSL
jgi:hypothetical protein